MSARDPIRSSAISQSSLAENLFRIYSSSATPVCIRDGEGSFIYNNFVFTEFIKGFEYSVDIWFDKLPSYIRLELLKCEIDLLSISESIVLSKAFMEHSFDCYVLLQKITIDNHTFTAWHFVKKVLHSGEVSIPELNKVFRGREVKNPALTMEANVYQTFCLYFTGFSHEFISGLLGVTPSASKKRISKAYTLLNINSKDEMLLFLRANSFLDNVHKYAFLIIRDKFHLNFRFI